MKYLLNIFFAASFLLPAYSSKAAVYTAVASGQYSNTATWDAGIVPPAAMMGDTIIIPWGFTVSLTGNLNLTGGSFGNVFHVDGTLNTSGNALTVGGVVMDGYGVINADSFSGNFKLNNFRFTGTLNAGRMDGSGIYSANAATINVSHTLYLTDTISLNNGRLVIGNNCMLHFTGGSSPRPPYLKIGLGAIITLPAAYDVTYKGTGMNTGMELSPTLRHLTMDMNLKTNSISLMQPLYANGKVHLVRGTLNLNSRNIVLGAGSDFVTDTAALIRSSSASDISVFSNTAHTGTMVFAPNADTVRNFIMNGSGLVHLGSNLNIRRALDLVKGKIRLGQNHLTITTGAIVNGGNSSSYLITDSMGTMRANVQPEQSLIFHIGTPAHYAPATVTSNAEDTSLYRGFSARVATGVMALADSGNNMAATQPMVNATWFLNHTHAKMNVDVRLGWDAGLEINGFDRSKAYMSHYVNRYWLFLPGSSAAADTTAQYAIARDTFKTLGAYAVFDFNTVAIKEVAAVKEVKVYPNPTAGILLVATEIPANAVVYNTMGQVVTRAALHNGSKTVDVQALPPGVYYMQLSGEGLKQTVKFVKQ